MFNGAWIQCIYMNHVECTLHTHHLVVDIAASAFAAEAVATIAIIQKVTLYNELGFYQEGN